MCRWRSPDQLGLIMLPMQNLLNFGPFHKGYAITHLSLTILPYDHTVLLRRTIRGKK